MKKLYLFSLLALTAHFAQAQTIDKTNKPDPVYAASFRLSQSQAALSNLARLRKQSAMLAAVYGSRRLADSTNLFSGGLLSASGTQKPLSAFTAALTQGTGITSFTYDGTTAATVSINQAFSPTWTGKHTFNNAVTAASGTAQGVSITPALTAAANNDVLAALDVAPIFTNGSFTGVSNAAIRASYTALGQNTADGVLLRNSTPSTASVQQYTPAVTWTASSWNTTSNISEPISYRMYVQTQAGSYLSNGVLTIGVSQNGGAYSSNDMMLDAYGHFGVGSSVTTYGGTTASGDGLTLGYGTTATSGSPTVYSGRIRLNANAWSTGSSSAQPTDFIIENKPITGSAVTAKMVVSSRIGTGAFTENFAIANNGLWYLNGTALAANQIIGANAGATGMEAKTISGGAGTGISVTSSAGTLTVANDTTLIQTVANLFPKADTRYLRSNVTTGGDLSGSFPNPTVAKFNGQLPSYYLNYANLTNKPTNVSSFTNDAGYLTSVSPAQITSALGFTPYNGAVNPNGYITSVSGSQVNTALGYTAADNNAVVHLTGAESITGAKTFTGNVSIGATTIPAGYQFAINGNTIATSVTVKAYSNWADYVFSPDYKLQSLSQVADYVHKNHHLEDMPTAAEVQKNGQNLGEMNEKLLKKVEELTLYLIEKDKQIAGQKEVIGAQEDRLKKQEERLKKIEEQLNITPEK